MTPIKTNSDRHEPFTAPAARQPEAPSQVSLSAELTRRSTDLGWDQMISDYAVIERRAQAMRSEAAWNMARAVRNWAVKVVSQGKAKAGAAATPLTRQGQPT